MARISAGEDFGQQVAQPAQLGGVTMPRAAFGVVDPMVKGGQDMEQQALRQIAQQEHEQAQARNALNSAQAVAKLAGLRDRMADSLAEIERGVLDGTIGKDRAAAAWQERSAAILDDGIGEVPESHRELARVDLSSLSQRLTSKVGDAVRRRDQFDTLSSIDATAEYTQRLATTDPEGARGIFTQLVDVAGPAAGLNPDQIVKRKQAWVEGTSYTRAFTAVNAAKLDNKALGEVEAGLQANQDIDPQRKAGLLAQIDGFRAANEARALRAAQHAEIVAARVQRESSAAFTVLSGWALAGKAANPEANAALIAKLTPTDAAAYRAMAAEIPARTAAAMLPLDAQAQQLDALYAQRAAAGTSERLEAEIKRREQVLKESRADYARDPLRAGQERGILDVPLQPLDASSVDTLALGMATRIQQAQTVATRTGKPVSPLLGEEADKLGKLLSAMPVPQRADRIAQLSSVLPPAQAQALAGQLMHGRGDDQRALGIAFALGAMRTTGTGDIGPRPTAELALKGAEALKAKTIKEERTPVDGWRGQIGKMLEGVYTNPQATEQVAEAARLILAGIVAEGGSGSANEARRALRLAAGGDLKTHNGARVLVPAGIEPADLDKRIRTMTPADLAPQLPDGKVIVNGSALSAVEFLARLPDAQLQYLRGDGNGAQYLVRTSPSGYAASSKREPLIITVGGAAK